VKRALPPKAWGQSRDEDSDEEDGAMESNASIMSESTTVVQGSEKEWVVGMLSEFDIGFFNGVEKEDQFVCFADPSNYKEHPGWMLRNLLVLVRERYMLKEVQILCYRDSHAARETPRSIILNLKMDAPAPAIGTAEQTVAQIPKITGWERNKDGKLAGKLVNLAEYMDPQRWVACPLVLRLRTFTIKPDNDWVLIPPKKPAIVEVQIIEDADANAKFVAQHAIVFAE
jgi:ubiquitin-like modifier-activating enzyme ATG7